MPLQPHASAYSAVGGRVGVLLIHDFTASPASLAPWGRALAEQGLAVEVPCLPGHGSSRRELNRTRWTDWYAEACAALDRLALSCDEVFVCGVSVGGCLSLRLAQERPDDVAGVVLVNPSVGGARRDWSAVPVVMRVMASTRGVGHGAKKSDTGAGGHDRTPLKALDSLRALWRATREDLPKVTVPLLLFRSLEDHAVEPHSAQIVLQRVSSRDVTERVLANSRHAAILDHEAASILTETVAFIRKHSLVPGGADAV